MAQRTRPILYNRWKTMRERCFCKTYGKYHRYGGRGIAICERWSDYKNFEADMLPTFRKGLTIDRIDNNGNYEPSNCRWSTIKEQCNNKNNNRRITYKGITKNLKQWAESLGIKRSTLDMRIRYYNWSIDRALGGVL